MPHIPDSTHDTHDLELVAAFAAGDAAGTALDDARALVATCADCAALHRDLRAIATAMPTLPVPARPRDFRLTPAQAAALRPRGWRGLVAAFGSPRFSFAAPLGSGLAALGLVGILVSSGGLPAGGGATAGNAAGTTQDLAAASAAPEVGAAASTGPALAAPAESPGPGDAGAKSDLASLGPNDTYATAGPDPVPSPAGPPIVPVAGVLLLIGGLGLVGSRVVARRLARAP